MRLGGPVFEGRDNPDIWIAALHRQGYSAAICPLNENSDDATIQAFAHAAERANIVIAEVGAWSNPISPDDTERAKAIALCQARLALADAIGACCCVNIAGSRDKIWNGPHPENFSADTFAMIVDSVRSIIDAVRPTRTYYTLETMPWIYPDSADSYLSLLKAINRPQAAVHLDPVNLVLSPHHYYATGELIRDCFNKLGSYIKSSHAKDIFMSERALVHLEEVRPGLGVIDYRIFLQELGKLGLDTPLIIEHLPSQEEYTQAASYIRAVAQEVGVTIV